MHVLRKHEMVWYTVHPFTKHIVEEHPDAGLGQIATIIDFQVLRTFEKPLERQVAEAVAIQSCKADMVLNSKAEWEQPAVERLIVTRELPEQMGRGGGARGRGGGRGRQARDTN